MEILTPSQPFSVFLRVPPCYCLSRAQAGFVPEDLEEPVYPPDSSAERWFSWRNYHEIPPALVGRMRIR